MKTSDGNLARMRRLILQWMSFRVSTYRAVQWVALRVAQTYCFISRGGVSCTFRVKFTPLWRKYPSAPLALLFTIRRLRVTGWAVAISTLSHCFADYEIPCRYWAVVFRCVRVQHYAEVPMIGTVRKPVCPHHHDGCRCLASKWHQDPANP